MRIESLRGLHGQFPDIDGFWHFDDLMKTEITIREGLPRTGMPWTPKDVEHLTQLARVQGLQGDLMGAKVTLENALEMIGKLEEKDRVRPVIRYSLELGRIHCLSMTPAKAQNALSHALKLAQELGDDY